MLALIKLSLSAARVRRRFARSVKQQQQQEQKEHHHGVTFRRDVVGAANLLAHDLVLRHVFGEAEVDELHVRVRFPC